MTYAQQDAPHHLIYTMRDLNQHTTGVIDEIRASGKLAFLTKHGRTVAIILAPGGEEADGFGGSLLEAMIEKYRQMWASPPESKAETTPES